jgi:plastocyanin
MPGRWWRAAPLAPGVLLLLGAQALARPDDKTPQRHLVEIQGMTFRPEVLEIERDDTVIWINRDIVPHTATGTGKPAWSTGTLAQSESGQYVPHDRGTTPYFCELHPVMQGKLIIR